MENGIMDLGFIRIWHNQVYSLTISPRNKSNWLNFVHKTFSWNNYHPTRYNCITQSRRAIFLSKLCRTGSPCSKWIPRSFILVECSEVFLPRLKPFLAMHAHFAHLITVSLCKSPWVFARMKLTLRIMTFSHYQQLVCVILIRKLIMH